MKLTEHAPRTQKINKRNLAGADNKQEILYRPNTCQ